MNEAVLTLNNRTINLPSDKTYLNSNGLQIWIQISSYNRPVANLVQKRRDTFLLYFRDDVDPYSNRSHKYSHCLVYTDTPDRVLFFFGGEKTWNECLDKILPPKAIRVWKICGNDLYEVTATPVTEPANISVTCPDIKK